MTVSARASLVFLLLAAAPASAQTNSGPAQSPASPEPLPGTASETQSPVVAEQGLEPENKLLGTLGGLRPRLERQGITVNLNETSEVFGNATGGRATGTVYEGVTNMSVDLDLEKAAGLTGATVRISALQIHGRGLSTNYVNNLDVVSSAEATRATRLFELWYQQNFWGGKADLRLGQQSADLEFALSSYGGLFTNASFGWPTSFAVTLPGGGPAYPLGVLGARLRARPRDDTTILLAVFNGSPAPPGGGDPQLRNAHGTSFRLNDGIFVIGEAQYALNGGEGTTGLPGTYKLGAWYNSRSFTNQFFTATVNSIGALATAAQPNDDWNVYAVADQLIWRRPGSADGGLGLFGRVTGGPGTKNQINVFANAGATYKGGFGRDADTVGLGVSWAHISETARDNDRAQAASQPGVFFPIRSSEVSLELTYQAQVTPWLTAQPVFQYIFSPGGGIVNPDRPDRRVGDAAVFGVRSTINF